MNRQFHTYRDLTRSTWNKDKLGRVGRGRPCITRDCDVKSISIWRNISQVKIVIDGASRATGLSGIRFERYERAWVPGFGQSGVVKIDVVSIGTDAQETDVDTVNVIASWKHHSMLLPASCRT